MAETTDFEDDFSTPVPPATAKVDEKPKKSAKSSKVEDDEKPAKGEPTPASIAQTPSAVTSRFVVQQHNTVAWKGQLIKLRAGSVVGDDEYGTGAMDYFRSRGVALLPAV
jgi:hypothetical protein